MKRVIIESPYAGEIELNVAYARLAVRDSVLRGEAPIASHLLFTQPGILDDLVPEERKLGIEAGLAWASVADMSVFYVDRGWSYGMRAALWKCIVRNSYIALRSLEGTPVIPTCLDEEMENFLNSCYEGPRDASTK